MHLRILDKDQEGFVLTGPSSTLSIF